MFLVADIGNSTITLSIFDKDVIVKKSYLNSNCNNTILGYELRLKNFISDFKIEKCIIGSVSDEVLLNFKPACENLLGINVKVADRESFKNLKIQVENPEKVGIDRLANVYALLGEYDIPVIVVDVGTAITFDILNGSTFIGGIIMPGINVQLKSLNTNTSKLPLVKMSEQIRAIGTSTEKAILSGVIRGVSYAVDGLIEECIRELNSNVVIVGCGGQCEVISKYMKRRFDVISKDLTLLGLKRALEIL